jgi:N-acetylglutamate synthase-like GNAT family acetyltransferase
MSKVTILQQPALECQDDVNQLLERNGSGGRARPADLFFTAYVGSKLVGCVRYCVEFQTPLLRTMMIDEEYRRQSIGQQLMDECVRFFDTNNIRNVYILPYVHLEDFYRKVGFKRVDAEFAPDFLFQRLSAYNGPMGIKMICMKRQ